MSDVNDISAEAVPDLEPDELSPTIPNQAGADEAASKQEDSEEDQEEGIKFVQTIPNKGDIAEGFRIPKEEPIGENDNAIVFPGASEANIDGPFRAFCDALKEDDWVNVVKTKWPELTQLGAELFAAIGADKPLDREGSVWSNNYQFQERRIGLTRPRIGGGSGNQALTGIKAMARASAQLGIGSPITASAVHSGISLTIKQMLNVDLLDLEARLALLKSSLGMATRGRVFSTADVFVKSAVMNFILDFVVASNWVGDYSDKEALKAVIKLPDVNLIIAQVAAALYPKGFLYTQPCLSRPGTCTATFEGRVNISEMIVYDTSYLTEKQAAVISLPGTPVTPEVYEKFHEDFALKGNRSFVVKGIRFDLHIPTFAQYESEGIAWIENIRTRYEKAFQSKMDPDAREEYIMEQGRATAMRQYSHWIERIVFLDENGEENGFIEDREVLAGQLGIFTNDEELAKVFYDKVEAFIADCTYGVVAVPNFICPACLAVNASGVQPVIGGRFDHLIAVDPAGVFFTLTSLRLSKTRQRADI